MNSLGKNVLKERNIVFVTAGSLAAMALAAAGSGSAHLGFALGAILAAMVAEITLAAVGMAIDCITGERSPNPGIILWGDQRLLPDAAKGAAKLVRRVRRRFPQSRRYVAMRAPSGRSRGRVTIRCGTYHRGASRAPRRPRTKSRSGSAGKDSSSSSDPPQRSTANRSQKDSRSALRGRGAGTSRGRTHPLRKPTAKRSCRSARSAEHRSERSAGSSSADRSSAIVKNRPGSAAPPLSALGRRFDLIYLDPPWRYAFSRSRSRRVENQYPTMSLAELEALDIDSVAADDCVLMMWTTAPKLAEALTLIESWGFTYKTCACWDKRRLGMGYYFRVSHELLLIATRGRPPLPPPKARTSSVISIRRPNGHSRKPAEVYELIERMYPHLSKVELFGRGRARRGWEVWGNEAIPSSGESNTGSNAVRTGRRVRSPSKSRGGHCSPASPA